MGYDCYTHYSDGDHDKRYFRANIWGMGEIRHALHEEGALNRDPIIPFPQYPLEEELDVAAEQLDAYEDGRFDPSSIEHLLGDLTEEQKAAAIEYYAALVETLRGTPSATVPSYKFGTNDGWWVTAEECDTLADAMDRYITRKLGVIDPMNREFFEEFRDYCRAAADLGGFHVF